MSAESDKGGYVAMNHRRNSGSQPVGRSMPMGHMHSTEAGRSAYISPPVFSAVGSWPEGPLVQWPAEAVELYFSWLLVEYEGVPQ